MGLIKSVSTVSGYTILSRILGVVREVMISHTFGASWVTDSFIMAIKVPSFLRRFFAEGALSAAFVPVVSADIEKKNLQAGVEVTSEVISLLVTFLTAMILLVIIFAKQAVFLFAPGFAGSPEKLELTAHLLQIAFPYIVLIAAVCLLSSLLSIRGYFAIGAATPAILNAIMIMALVIWPGDIDTLSWSLLVGGVVQLACTYYVCWKCNMKVRLKKPKLTKNVKIILRRMGPGAISAGVFQINLMLDMVFASFLPAGSVSFLYYADRLNQLPLSVFGIAIGTVLLPMLSKHVARNDKVQAHKLQEQSLYLGLQLSIPSMVGLFVLSYGVICWIYGHGKFTSEDAIQTSYALQAFVTGLPGYVLCKNLNNVYFASGDTRTPLKVACYGVIINLLANIILIFPFKHIGLAIATSIAAWFNAFLLIYILKKKGLLTFSDHFKSGVKKTIFTAFIMAIVVKSLHLSWPDIPPSLFLEGVRVVSFVCIGLFIYLVMMWFLKALYLPESVDKTTNKLK